MTDEHERRNIAANAVWTGEVLPTGNLAAEATLLPFRAIVLRICHPGYNSPRRIQRHNPGDMEDIKMPSVL